MSWILLVWRLRGIRVQSLRRPRCHGPASSLVGFDGAFHAADSGHRECGERCFGLHSRIHLDSEVPEVSTVQCDFQRWAFFLLMPFQTPSTSSCSRVHVPVVHIFFCRRPHEAVRQACFADAL